MDDPILRAAGSDVDTGSGAVTFNGRGHPYMVAGLRQYYARNARLIVAAPGSIVGYPTLGAGLGQWAQVSLTETDQQTVATAVSTVLAADPLTESVDSVTVTQPDADTTLVIANVTINGQPQQLTFPVPSS